MRFKYSTTAPEQDESDRLPRVPLVLRNGVQATEVVGLVDSGATVNFQSSTGGTPIGFAIHSA